MLLEHQLADLLVSRGLVPRDRLDALLARRARTGDRRPLEALLLDARLVDPTTLRQALEAARSAPPPRPGDSTRAGSARIPIVPVPDSGAAPGSAARDSWDVDGLPSTAPGGLLPGPEELCEGQLLTPRPGLELAVRGLLGRGGMGVVYLVLDARLRRLAALKLVRATSGGGDRAARFLREVAVTAQLDHPGIPPVYEAGVLPDTGQAYLLMRYLPGQSLAARLREVHGGAPAPLAALRELLSLLVRVAEAVAYAHSRGVVHRDLKPANIVLGTFGEVCVVDWGLARDVRETPSADAALRRSFAADAGGAGAAPGLTADGSIIGTVGYMAPEQARREDVDARADVFSLGAILSFVLTGEAPFAGGPAVALLVQAGTGQVTYPDERRDLPPELASIARRALAPAAGDRYPTAEAFAKDLQAWLEGREVAAHRYGLRERALRALRARPALAAALGGGCVVAAVGLTGAVAARDRAARAAQLDAVDQARRAAEAAAVGTDGRGADDPADAPADAAAAAGAEAAREARLRVAGARIARALAGLSAAQRWHAVARDDPAARRRRFDAATALGAVAEAAEQWPLALEAYGEAAALGVDDAAAARRRDAVAAAAAAEPRRRAEALREVLARARAGGLEAPGAFEDALFALCRHPEPAAVVLLVEQLDALTAALRDAELAVWRAVEAPAPEELREGERPLPGLVDAARRDLLRSDGAPPAPQDAALLARGAARLWRRLTRPGPVPLTDADRAASPRPAAPQDLVRDHIAARQREAIGLPLARTSALVATALGRLGLRDGAAPALVAHLRAHADPEAAVPVAVALCRLGGVDAVRAVRGACARLGPRLDRPALEALRAARLDDLAAAGAASGASARERGVLLADVGRAEEALRAFDAALAAAPDDPDALRQRAGVRLRLGDRDGALADAGRAATLAPTPAALFALGNVRRERGEVAEAEAAYSRGLELSPDAVELLMNRGVCRDLREAHAEAEADFRRARELEPLLATAWLNEGNSQLKRGDADAAYGTLTRAIELDPAAAKAWSTRSQARERLGDLGGALQDLVEAVRLDPRDPRTWHNLGFTRQKAGQVEQAVLDFGRALQLEPRATTYFSRGQALRQLGRREEGLADLTEATRLAPRDPDAWTARAVALLELGRTEEALADLGRALEVAPRHAIARFNRAMVHRNRDDFVAARADLEALARDAPTALEPLWFQLGVARFATGDARGAAEALVRAQGVRPDDPLGWILGGLAHECTGEHEAALAALRRVAATRVEAALWLATLGGPTDALARVAAGEGMDALLARWHLGRVDDAGLLAAAEAGPEAGRRSRLRRAYLHLGVVAARAGRTEAARAHLRRSLEVDPGDERVESVVARQRLAALEGAAPPR